LGARPVQAASGGACTPTTAQRVARDSLEAPVLMAINKERRDGGLEPAPRVTVPLLAAFLEGRALGGARWRRGAKKRDELLDDARCAPRRAAPRAAPGVLAALPRAPCCRMSVWGHAARDDARAHSHAPQETGSVSSKSARCKPFLVLCASSHTVPAP